MNIPSGVFIELPCPESVEIACLAGWDFVVIDSEHGTLNPALLPGMLRAASVPAVVRVSSASSDLLQFALDSGASGVLVPQIQSAAQAAAVVQASRFHPRGRRGLNGFVRAAKYSLAEIPEYLAAADRSRILIQIETQGALSEVEAIAALEGVDELFIGPYDLSQALSLPGQVLHENVLQAGRRIIAAAHDSGKQVSVFANTFEAAALWRDLGVDSLHYSADVFHLAQSLRRVREDLRRL